MARRSKGAPPPLLQRLYGEGRVLRLRELLLRLSALSRDAAALAAALVQPHDHADYREALLERTWCVLRPGAPPLRDGFSLSQATGQQQLVGRAVEALLRSSQNKSAGGGAGSTNVLCYGYRRRRPAAGGRSVPGMATAEASHHNSTTASLCSPAWQLLLSRVGDTLMLYLLLHVSMFAELPNSCCLQLSGPPISSVARAWKKDALPPPLPAAQQQTAAARAAQGAAGPAGEAAAEQPALTQAPGGSSHGSMEIDSSLEEPAEQVGGQPAGSGAAEGRQAEAPALLGQQQQAQEESLRQDQSPPAALVPAAAAQAQAGGGQGKKKVRPSSWQRRRAAKLRQQHQEQQVQQAAAAAAGEGSRDAAEQGSWPAEQDWELPPTEEAEAPVELDRSGGDLAAGSSSGGEAAAARDQEQPPAGEQQRQRQGGKDAADEEPAAAGPGQGGGRAAAGDPAGAKAKVGWWPARMPRPSDMVLQRTPIFYCASFPQRPGLTTQHVLSKLKAADQADRRLFAAIFDPQHNPVGRAGAAFSSAHSTVPPPAKRVPARQRHLLPLLRQLINRAGKCPYSILLQHHCPLPPQLQEELLRRRRQRQRPAGAAGDGAGEAAGAATDRQAAAGGLAAAGQGEAQRQPLPSQGELLRQMQQQEQQAIGQRQAVGAAGGTAVTAGSLDTLMDELFALEQRQAPGPAAGGLQPAGGAGAGGAAEGQQQAAAAEPFAQEEEEEERRQGQQAPAPSPVQQQQQQQQPARVGKEQREVNVGRADPSRARRPDSLMDELFCLEQQQQQEGADQPPSSLRRPSKRPRTDPPAPGGSEPGSLPPTQPDDDQQQPPQAQQPQPQPTVAATAAAAEALPAAAQPAFGPPLAACFVPHRRVTAFVWSVVRSVVPAALLGDAYNQGLLRDAIGRFIRLRRYEQMSVHQVMQGLRMSGFPWLDPSSQTIDSSSRQGADPAGQRQPGGDAEMAAAGGQGPAADSTAQQHQQRQQQQHIPRPCPPSLHAWQQRQLSLWLGWLLSVLVVPLLRAHFYCTESEAYRQQVFYYRKPVWAALARAAGDELREQQFTPLPDARALEILQGRKLGIARVRLLPKRAGMRVILNLGRGSTVRFRGVASSSGQAAGQGQAQGQGDAQQQAGGGGRGGARGRRGRRAAPVKLTFRPVNSLLQNVYQVLRYEASCQPHLLGASVFGYNDAFCKLQPFVRKWRASAEAAASAGQALVPLLVSVDVTRAFDHVDIPLLLSLAEPLLRHDNYVVLKYSEVVPSLGQVKVLHRRLAAAAPQPSPSSAFGGSGPGAGPDSELPPFPELARRWAGAHKGKAFTDQVTYDRLSKHQALDLLRQHLTANIVRLRRRWCVQSRGIAQGSTLSTLLCSLYLAHLERTQLAPILSGPQLPDGTAAGLPLAPGQAGEAAAEADGAGGGAAEGSAAGWRAGRGAAGWPGGATAAAAAAGGEGVVCLAGGSSAAWSPAEVFVVGGWGSSQPGGGSGSSRGLLTELARAAESLVSAPPQQRAASSALTPAQQAQQGGSQLTPQPTEAAGGEQGRDLNAPQQQQQGASRPSTAGAWGPGSSGRGSLGPHQTPCGDLLLLPAGATPAPGTAVAEAAAATASVGCAARAGASPAGPSHQRLGRPWSAAAGAAAGTDTPGTSPAVAAGTVQRQQGQIQQQQGQIQQQGHQEAAAAPDSSLGCGRLALHAGSLLLRLVDDFLLVTAVPAVASGFASRMLEGFDSHNVFVNPDKTKLSFALQLPSEPSADEQAAAGPLAAAQAAGSSAAAHATGTVVPASVWRSADGATFVKWCGLLVNTASLELQGDYTRYAGEHLSTSLTLPLRKRPGAQLPTRLCHYLRPKIHPLLLDATLNSPQTVALNIYQAFLLGAMKFHCYVRALPSAPAPGNTVLLDAILSGVAFMTSLTRGRRLASAHQQGLQAACATKVPPAHVRWLGLTAFLTVLRRKQPRYAPLLRTLRELAEAPALSHAARQLAAVVDPARSSAFDLILY